MKQTSAFHFIPQFNASRLSFDDVVESVKQHINSLSENKQKKLKDEMENGLANLTTKEQLDIVLANSRDFCHGYSPFCYKSIL